MEGQPDSTMQIQLQLDRLRDGDATDARSYWASRSRVWAGLPTGCFANIPALAAGK